MYTVERGAKRAIKAAPKRKDPVPEMACTAQYYKEIINYK